jgi:hypothetical protein
MPQAIYATNKTREVAGLVDKVIERVEGGARKGEIFDSVKNESGFAAPEAMQPMLGRLHDDDASRIFDAVADGIKIYKQEHGVAPTADVVEAAIQQGHAAMTFRPESLTFDSAMTSVRHEAGSMQPNRAVVAVLSGIAEAIPFASYLPVDIGSNEAKLIIASHIAGSTYGDYANGGIMDGIDLGGSYTSTLRFVKFDTSGAQPWDRKFTQINLGSDAGYCDPAGTGVPVLRGRTIVSINGLPVASDNFSGSSANSPFSGSIKLPGQSVTLTISGYVTVANGAIQITSLTGGSLPTGSVVTAESVIDYETSPSLIPSVMINAIAFPMFANSSRVKTVVGQDALGQFQNEMGLDPRSEALMAVRNQAGAERHYMAMRMAYNLAQNNVVPYNFDYAAQSAQKVRAQIWQDGQSIMGEADQKMANATMDHGITHLYVPEFVKAQLEGLGSDLFVPSGLSARAGVYRVGRLYGKYEVYYSPKVVSQSADRKSAKILAVGRSNNVARCPIVLGDAIAPTFLDLNMNDDLKSQQALYSRDFTKVNPHQPSALGCALIDLTNLA